MEIEALNLFVNVGHLVYWSVVVSVSIGAGAYITGKILDIAGGRWRNKNG
jgi:hypothetical protein